MTDKKVLVRAICLLYREASASLPADVVHAMQQALRKEKKGTLGHSNLSMLLENIELAQKKAVPMCQDSGSMNFYVQLPKDSACIDAGMVHGAILEATKKATAENILRPNTVDSVTGKNTGDNVGVDSPHVVFDAFADKFTDKETLVIDLLLKGGGCENVSRQYSLPFRKLNAMRGLDGVKKVVLDCVTEALGFGCPPAVLGICIGGTRDTGYAFSKRQLMRRLTDTSKDRTLAKLESEIVKESNRLGIGTSGLGGNVTVLAAKVAALHRIPASFFVSISYDCWALRRKRLVVKGNDFKVMETYEKW